MNMYLQKPMGLVLAGGYSTRMKQDKATLDYHGKPQCQHVFEMLQTCCQEVFVSAKSGAAFGLPTLQDPADFGDIGPIAGLCAAFRHSKAAWLVVAVDYPFFAAADIEYLLSHRTPNACASVYFNPESGFFEPFLGVYEADFSEILTTELSNGNHSLQRIIRMHAAHRVIPERPNAIQSVDTPEAYAAALHQIAQNQQKP